MHTFAALLGVTFPVELPFKNTFIYDTYYHSISKIHTRGLKSTNEMVYKNGATNLHVHTP